MIFAKRLRMLRDERKLTQDALAGLTGISKSSISMYENNNRIPELETFERLADFFNVNMDFLKGKSDTRSPFQTLLPPSLTPDESEILTLYRQAEPTIKEAVRSVLKCCTPDMRDEYKEFEAEYERTHSPSFFGCQVLLDLPQNIVLYRQPLFGGR